MAQTTISQKIDSFAQAHLKELKADEAKTNRKMTKFDVAQFMLKKGVLNSKEYASWMNTREGFDAQTMTTQQQAALKRGNVWGFAGYGGGQESYLDSMTSFSQKNPVEKQNAISGTQMKLNQSVAERKKKAAELTENIRAQKRLNPQKTQQEQEFKAKIDKLPTPTETYTELMNDIKFQDMSREEKTKFLMETAGKKAYEARERGDKAAAKEYLMQGIGYTFAYMDEKAGITDIKEAAKKYSGLNALTNAVDKWIDDGDNANLSMGERVWEGVKGAGDAVDSFIGTQGAAFVGTLAVASEAAAAAGVGKVFAVATQAYFGVEGAGLVYDGAKDLATAETKEQARQGGQELTTGGIMVAGALKSAKDGYDNYKASKAQKAQGSNTVSPELKEELVKETATAEAPNAVPEAEATPTTPKVSKNMSVSDMRELAKTPEGVKQLEEAGRVVTKDNLTQKLKTVYEGQSQSPARAIKKIDFSGTPEEVCAKNPPLQYDKAQGKFFREVSWDSGKTKQPMYIDQNDPNGYFIINYGKEAWDGALLGGTEAIKSYVEPEPYNASGTKVPLDPAKMNYEWTTASKAAPVRFARVPEGVKGIVGKEGFQPITGQDQVVAIDVKGNPYINTVDYVLNNTKGLDVASVKSLLEIDPFADASKALKEIAKTPEGLNALKAEGLIRSINKEPCFQEGFATDKNQVEYIKYPIIKQESEQATSCYVQNIPSKKLTEYDPNTRTYYRIEEDYVETKEGHGKDDIGSEGYYIKHKKPLFEPQK